MNHFPGEVAIAYVKHPIVEGSPANPVSYQIDPNGFVFRATNTVMTQNRITPLLVEANRPNETVPVVCAIRAYENGIVILRPKVIDSASRTEASFGANLVKFSLNPVSTSVPPVRTGVPPARPRQQRRPLRK